MGQLRKTPLQISWIGIHWTLRLVIYTVPHDHVLPPRRRWPANGEQQAPIESDLQVSQHFPSQRTIGQVAGSRKAHRKECSARMRVLWSLNATRNAGNSGRGQSHFNLIPKSLKPWKLTFSTNYYSKKSPVVTLSPKMGERTTQWTRYPRLRCNLIKISSENAATSPIICDISSPSQLGALKLVV